jgi:hypothetical protein
VGCSWIHYSGICGGAQRPAQWERPVKCERKYLTAKGTTRATYWVPLAIVAAVFAIAAGWHIKLPGLYMDAVDPDFLVVRILNPNGYEIPPWVLPGNYPAQRFPILTSLYRGTQQVWLGLPGFLILARPSSACALRMRSLPSRSSGRSTQCSWTARFHMVGLP